MRMQERIVGGVKRRLRTARLHLSGTAMKMPAQWLPSLEYAAKFDAPWHMVYEKSADYYKPPVSYGARPVDFTATLEFEFPELGLLELKNGCLFGRNAWVVSQEKYFLPQHCWYGLHVEQMKIPQTPFQPRKINGVCLSLSTDWGSKNYCHFLLEGISRYDLFIKAGFSLSDVDFVLCEPPFQNSKQMLAQLGIPLEKCIFPADAVALQADVVLAPSFPGMRRNPPRWVVEFLRDNFGSPVSAAPHRRLYIPRTSRKVSNEADLLPILAEHGFEIFDPARYADTPKAFSQAEIVVGAHGAGLANVAFCQPGAKVLELIPSDHMFPYFYALSESAGLQYSCIVGTSTVERENYDFGGSCHDFRIDGEEFRQALKSIVN